MVVGTCCRQQKEMPAWQNHQREDKVTSEQWGELLGFHRSLQAPQPRPSHDEKVSQRIERDVLEREAELATIASAPDVDADEVANIDASAYDKAFMWEGDDGKNQTNYATFCLMQSSITHVSWIDLIRTRRQLLRFSRTSIPDNTCSVS